MTDDRRNKILNLVLAAGTTLLLLAAALPLFGVVNENVKWLFAFAAAAVLLARIGMVYRGKSVRIKRLHRIEIFSAVLYCLAAFTLFAPELNINIGQSWGSQDWLAFLLAGAVLQIYASWIIDRETKALEEKDSQNEKKD